MYKVTVGLEIHAELKTATKMFCGCRNAPDEKTPNFNVCAVCLAHPGTLPVINKEAVRKVLMVGKAAGGTLADYTEFDRKNYFYPDIPKGYQISQYKFPLVSGGILAGVQLTRIHLEEDTARSQHIGENSLVDYNRAGVPLMELVTEPVIHSAEEAGAFARELQLLLRTLEAGEANMEKGEMRVEANISVSKDGVLGTKVEVKNLNSFRSVERAIAYEFDRQVKLLEGGGQVVQETRGWDEQKQVTFSQRKKESSHDYRYFPDPDLPSLRIFEIAEFQNLALPELPWQQRERLRGLGFLQEQDIEQLLGDVPLAGFFNQVTEQIKSLELKKSAANYILNDVAGIRKDNPGWLPDMAVFIKALSLPSPQAKSSIASGVLAQVVDDSALPRIAQQVIDANPAVVADYKAGKQSALQFLIGQGMKASRGSANPQVLREAIQKILG
jgi:aspartyl-tRNA(Asn)/glutamyl-tRNA(Gln) amidotransferase subunit B